MDTTNPIISTLLPSLLTTPHLKLLTLLLTLTLPILTLLYIHHDYCAFLSLGPGGTPSTPLGYLKIKLLSIVSLRNPYRPLPVPAYFRPQRGYLSTSCSLTKREGRRPIVRGIAPQRQQTQKSPVTIYATLVSELHTLAREPRNQLVERTSCFEKHSSGLFASTPITRTCGGEICHAHPSDGSLHMTLHPADAKIVLESGWGERHPLAKGGWFRRFVPREFVLVYAPRDEGEVEIVIRIVQAAIWWVSGVDAQGGGSGDRVKGKDRGVGEEDLLRTSKENECWACRVHGCGRKGVEKLVERT
ncbi:uncharacterized protein BDR25DRAFT_385006 [Lindgomyces ingoldianus]|uniref:Uncharacterized protein n=1 Tax=Lindgomyces ingoldianus TaxID=673940 RepID=A0ACB6Q8K4_9PLEO|nr:uncharacterized protein BDR25DRAFT_385006 [Lindgomyces ingoldianus]KAF2463211.1 hypothetical protein BDR25DRAFT_385006 [Lindgomyces ingoldianus]